MGTIRILLLCFFTLSILNISFTNGSSNRVCIESEKQALLMFKQYLVDPADRLVSWVDDEDCCRWAGVVCNNETGHVLELHLGNPTFKDGSPLAELYAFLRSRIGGKINNSLLNLKHLSYLDLSNNDFRGIHIPRFFGSMGSLRYLNLSNAGFGGLIPHQLGNLSNMQYLDLNGGNAVYVENLRWLAGLSQLKYLGMSYSNLSKAFDLLQIVNRLSSLKELHLSNCELPPASALLNPNMSSLAILDLHSNHLENSPFISWVFSLKTLVSLDLSQTGFKGPIPDGLRNLTSLRYLDLSGNNFNSSIPDWLYSFSPLEFLDLGGSVLRGKISSAIGNMTYAISLDLSWNELEGIPRSIGNLCNLRSLSLFGSNLSLKISDILEILSGCISSGLESLDLGNCQLSGQLTSHLGYFKNLKELNLGSNSISGSIPQSLGELSMLRILYVSNNKLKGNLPESLGQLASLEEIYISGNLLEGVVNETHFANLTKLKTFYGSGNSLILKVHPNWIPPFQLENLKIRSWNLGHRFPTWIHSQKQLAKLVISNSGISDSIPSWFWNMSSQISQLSISQNQIYGKLPNLPFALPGASFDFSSNSFSGSLPGISSNLTGLNLSNNSLSSSLSYFLCNRMNELMKLAVLNLDENLLFGEIPDCWVKWPNLKFIKLDSNKFAGSLPRSLGTLRFLESLHLRNNRLLGELPLFVKNYTNLLTLDLGENELNGHIPTWLGVNLQNLMVLSLRSNKFHGHVPNELCALGSLQILDLSYNNISGYIPKCIGNFSAMVMPGSLFTFSGYDDNVENAFLVMKGNLVEYSTILGLVKSIDLSGNNLQGEIPNEMTKLQGLLSLNLSNNHLIGRIPEGIGAMTSLESIDFSANQLSGPIPQSMSNLTFLSHLNLSNNNLIGQIPSSTQLQSFDASSFIGNQLCGPPVTKNCSTANGEFPNTRNEGKNDGNGLQVDWFYVMMAIGFATGFGAVLVPLMLSRWWRYLYFQFLDQMWTRLVLLYAKATKFHKF